MNKLFEKFKNVHSHTNGIRGSFHLQDFDRLINFNEKRVTHTTSFSY